MYLALWRAGDEEIPYVIIMKCPIRLKSDSAGAGLCAAYISVTRVEFSMALSYVILFKSCMIQPVELECGLVFCSTGLA